MSDDRLEMGVDTRKPILPAPTDSSTLESNAESVVGTDLATDLSRATDKTSYSIPEDGRPITINTGKRTDKGIGKLKKGGHQSQTSLLIEYFEGGKDTSDVKARPSIRVKVTPSSKSRKTKEHNHLLVTETGSARVPSLTRRISLGTSDSALGENRSSSSVNLVTDDPTRHRRDPSVEVELLPRSDLSGSSVSKEARFIVPDSDVSSMPPDSMLEGAGPAAARATAGAAVAAATHRRERSRSLSPDDIALEKETLKAPSRRRSRSLSRERLITQKAMEKLGQRSQQSPTSHKHRSSRERSISKDYLEGEVRSPRRRRHREEDSVVTGTDSNLTANSASLLSPNRKSGDAYSFRSGTSKSSINNPKLLETVEDAIRRLILPELRDLKKDQKVEKNRRIFEHDDDSLASGSSISRESPRRRVSKRSTAEGKPRVVLQKDSKDSELSSGGRRRKHRKDYGYESPSERSYSRRESGDSTILDEEKSHRRRKDHRIRDAAAGALAGGALTAAALKSHDSKSGDKERRRKRRSKSRSSRSASIAESEEIFHKHDVPPMPMRSEVDTELTRSSLLSEQTASTMTPTQKEVRNVVRGSPMEVRSPAATTPSRSSASLQQGLGTRHGNVSKGDLSLHTRTESEVDIQSPEDSRNHHLEESTLAGVAGGLGGVVGHDILDDEERVRRYEQNLHQQHPIRKGLSPIQSVASYRDDASEPNRESVLYRHSLESSSSLGKHPPLQEERSYDSFSSANSSGLAKKRPLGVTLENRSEVMGQHADRFDGHSGDERSLDDWYDEQHRENDKYRHSYNSSDPRLNSRRTTTYTEDSLDAPYSDKTGAGQQVSRGAANNAELVDIPQGVESAVASLYEPSLVGGGSVQLSRDSFTESLDREALSPKPLNYGNRDSGTTDKRSPLRHEVSPEDEEIFLQQRARVHSPPQSVTRSIDGKDLAPQMGTSALPDANEPMPEIGHGLDSPESEITTNPSVIQGPIGGISHENREHWPYDPTPPHSKADLMSPRSDNAGISATEAALAAGALGAGLGAAAAAHGSGHDKDRVEAYNNSYDPKLAYDPNRDSYMSSQMPGSPGVQDEGYISGKPPSISAETPELKANDKAITGDDPFVGHNRHLSGGFSHGMRSPLYDSATGQGIDRIQSKDIVALMDHLTVRDAQRNARDTEILVTLVRTAAEMRTSFLDMKQFIRDQDDWIMDTADRQHEKTVQRVIGGPRPQPLGTPRFPKPKAAEDTEDSSMKRRNIFKRALQGLGSKNTNELQNIEAMLTQLLDEVEGLRAAQEGRPPVRGTDSLESGAHTRGTMDEGYEPEGQAGTSSTGGDRSGFLSVNSSRQGNGYGPRRTSENQNRVSTVMEGDEEVEEELAPHEQDILEQHMTNEDSLLTPTKEMRDSREHIRGSSVPLATPPRKPIPVSGALSNENTPRMSDDGKRKHKSSSSSFFPKISRWSKTTASSVGDTFRSSMQSKKDRPYSHVSRSGSDLEGDYGYDPTADDRIRSNTSFNRQENRPPSPLVPSQISDNPKYQAHRNSLNLQHPQPRQGPTGRYQHHLETQADIYSPQSPTASEAEHWASIGEPRLLPTAMDGTRQVESYENRPNGRVSPLSDVYSESSSAMMELGEEEARRSASTLGSGYANPGPPRPPKVRDDGPLIPDRPPKIAMSPVPAATRQPTYADHVAAQRGSSLSPAGPTAVRKPSGPRPITSSGQYSPGGRLASREASTPPGIKKTRFRGSPNHIESSSEGSLNY